MGTFDVAAAFSTGPNALGYTLSSVDVRFKSLSFEVSGSRASKVSVTVNAASGGVPGAVVGSLAWPVTAPFDSERVLRFAASGGISLEANTTYFVVFDVTGFFPTGTVLASTEEHVEDSGAAAGWSVADTHRSRIRTSGTWSNTLTQSLGMGVNGEANTVSSSAAPLVSAPEVVFVGEGETVSVRLDLAQEVTGRIPVTVSSSDPSRVRVNHPDRLFMGRKYVNGHNARNGVVGHQVQTNVVSGDSRGAAVRTRPSGSISFDFTSRDWAGYTDIDEPVLHKGYRVVEVTGVASGADGLPANGPDAKFQLLLSSSHSSVAFAPITVVVKRSRGLDPVFDPDPRFSFGCRERECLRVAEGGTVSYTVRNFNVPAPGSPLTITPTGVGLSFDPAVVSWTHTDHDEPRTVTVTAAHDADSRSEARIIRHVFSENWDTSGSLSKILRRSESKAEAESSFNMAVAVQDDDVSSFDTVSALGRVVGQVKILSRPGFVGSSGVGRFWVTVDGPPDCAGRTPGLCWDVLYIRLRTRNADGTYDNADMTATVYRADRPPALGGSAAALPYTRLAGPKNWFGIRITPHNWNRPFRVNLELDPSLVNGISSGHYDISLSLAHANGEPTQHSTLRASWGPVLSAIPDSNSYVDANNHPVSDDQQAQDAAFGEPQQDQPGQQQPQMYVPDPQVVAAVQYLASQTHHGFAHVNRWQRALAALGALDPADVTGGALTLAEAKQNTNKYSSPVWDQIVTEIQAKQTHDTQQQQPQQDQQPQQPQQDQPQQDPPLVVVPEVTVASASGATEGTAVTFTVAASPAPAADLSVAVAVTAAGDYGVTTGTRTVTIPAGVSSATLSVATTGDTTDEPDGTVTATVTAGDGYTIGQASTRTAPVTDDDNPPPQQEQQQQDQPAPYAADPQVVAAVQYLASQTHHGFAHVNRWQRALAALGALDPADVTGGALTLTEAKQNTKRYSSPVWHQVVAEIEAKQAFDTQQQK